MSRFLVIVVITVMEEELGWEDETDEKAGSMYRPKRGAEFVGWADGEHREGRRSMTEMTREERVLFDARADNEAWSHAAEILEPWVKATRVIGSDELTRVMEKALAEVEGEVNRTLDVLEPLVEARREGEKSAS